MNKFKHTLLLLFIAFTASAQTITDPVEYNDFFVNNQNRIGDELLELIGMFDNLPFCLTKKKKSRFRKCKDRK